MVIRSYFYKLDINPTARIGNEAEMALLQQEVLADLLTNLTKKVFIISMNWQISLVMINLMRA